uniref:Uncharacterized protein n=1 Tax=Arundo donax TaxID=35708 RepID=A0A0A9HAB8_ARUDO
MLQSISESPTFCCRSNIFSKVEEFVELDGDAFLCVNVSLIFTINSSVSSVSHPSTTKTSKQKPSVVE